MKSRSLIFAGLIAGILLCAAIFGGGNNLKTTARAADTQSGELPALPSFLEKGKVYTFYFGASIGGQYGVNPVTIMGRIEKIEAASGWVYINYLTYVNVPKKKELERKFEGYGWINIRQAFQCVEVNVSS